MLTSKQRARLRAMANTLNDTVLIGKEGITDAVIAQTEEVLEKHELIKIKVLETAMMTAKEVQAELCEAVCLLSGERIPLRHGVLALSMPPCSARLYRLRADK